jgi:hypothetical protein
MSRFSYATIASALVVGCAHLPFTNGGSELKQVAGVGFEAPENVVYDSVADVFLVSSMGRTGQTHDGDGFVSRVAPDGHVITLRWISRANAGEVLDAPKGLAIHGDTLAVADLGCVKLFDRRTGQHLRTIALPGVVMNDVRWGNDGTLWITDTGPDRSKTPIDTTKDMDALWRVDRDGRVEAVARGLALDRPDGLVLDETGALIATFGANRIEHVDASGARGRRTIVTLPGGRADGLRRLPDRSLVATSWDAQAVWKIAPGGTPVPLLTHVPAPAGLAVDTRRNQLAVTSVQRNALYLVPLGSSHPLQP